MTIRRTEKIAGILVAEEDRMPWWLWQFDKASRVMVCGEIGHVRWELYQTAWRAVVRKERETALATLAERVGVEYTPRRTHNQDNEDSEHAGGTPWQ